MTWCDLLTCQVVCDPVVARRVLSDTKTFVKGVDYSYTFGYVFGEGLVTSQGEAHQHGRAIFGKYFIKSHISKFVHRMNLLVKGGIEEKMKRPMEEIGAGNDTLPVNIEEFFATLALRIFMTFALSQTYNDPARETFITKSVSRCSWAVGRLVSLNLPMWSIFPPVAMLDKLMYEFHTDWRAMIAERRAMIARGEGLDIDDVITAMINENMDEKSMMVSE